MENKIRKAIREQIKKLKEDYKPSHRAYNVIDKSNNDEIVAKELSRDKALELAHTNKNYMIDATDRLAETMSPEEWEAAKEADRLDQHPEKDTISKIRKMMDKEKSQKESMWGDDATIGLAAKALTKMKGGGDDFSDIWNKYNIKQKMIIIDNSDIELDPTKQEFLAKLSYDELINKLSKEDGYKMDYFIYDGLTDNEIKRTMDETKPGWTPPPYGEGGEDDNDKKDWTPEDHEEEEEHNQYFYKESLKEIASQLGYLKENLPISLQQLEKEIKDLTGEYGSVSEREPGIWRIKFSYVKQELDGRVWGGLMKLIKSHPNDYEIIDAQNYYEENYEWGEPAEAVPTINFK